MNAPDGSPVDLHDIMKHLLTLLALGTLLVAAPSEAQTVRFARRATYARLIRPRIVRAPVIRWNAWRASGIRTPSRPHPEPIAPAPRRPGLVRCTVTAAGTLAPATVEVRHQGRVIASGTCGERISVPAGRYDATITLERAIDRPQQTVPLFVPEDGVGTARAAFDTSILEVRFFQNGRRTFGQAILEQNGRVIGSIGSGVVAHVSSGRVTIRARHLTEWRTYTVDLAPGQRRAIIARF